MLNNIHRSLLQKPTVLAMMFVSCFILNSCGIYSFTGTSLSPDIKTFTVTNFTMGTAGGPADLTQKMSEQMKEYYQKNTSLTQLPSGGDLIVEGTITGYDVLPTAPTANDQAGSNRLTMSVQVRFTNAKDETKNFDQSFSFFADFPQNQTLNQNEARLIPILIENIVQQIFNKSAADW